MKIIAFLIILITVSMGDADAANEYTKGHGALEVFDSEGMAASPTWVKLWIAFMAATFFAGLFFVRNHPIARWVVGGFVVGFIITSLAPKLGFIVLSGFIACIHIICWSPALYQLLTKHPFLASGDMRSAFTIWSGVMTFVILFSFIFDFRDAYIYLAHIF